MRARRLHHCRRCRTETAQEYGGVENGNRPAVETWRCVPCRGVILSLPGVPDVEGLVLDVGRRGGSARLPVDEREELLGHLAVETWRIYGEWDPGRGVPLLAFLTGMLRLEVVNWWRNERGRNPEKPKAHWGAVSLDAAEESRRERRPDTEADEYLGFLDADPLGSAVGEGTGDRETSSLADLRWTLSRRGRDVAEEERKMGLGADEGAPLGASAAR